MFFDGGTGKIDRLKHQDIRMSTAPFISVVTPTFNCEKTLQETIESVLSQGCDDVEHVIIDGGSTDGTIDILRRYPHLKWTTEKDEGHYHAMHKGVLASRGKYFSILNADDCFKVGALKAVILALKKQNDWDGLFGDVLFVDQYGKKLYAREEACFDYNVLRFGLGYVIHPAFFLSRDFYERLGGFRYKELKNCADYDLILRAGALGAKVGHVPQILVDYRFHPQGQSSDKRIQDNMRRESALLQIAHGKADGFMGRVQETAYKAKRQLQKLFLRGRVDFVPGNISLRKVMQDKCDFSSNIGLSDLPEVSQKPDSRN